MQHGLFGKLPHKRDFINMNTPRSFINVWEGWLQNALYESQEHFGTQWRDVYFAMPIWRFWLGSGHCGFETIGAMMPSIDGADRCYPLTLIQVQEGYLSPSSLKQSETCAHWFERAETILNHARSTQYPFEQIKHDLQTIAPIHIREPANMRTSSLESIWWQRNQSLTFSGALNPALFKQLMTPSS